MSEKLGQNTNAKYYSTAAMATLDCLKKGLDWVSMEMCTAVLNEKKHVSGFVHDKLDFEQQLRKKCP